jgi:hypothetical protein
MQFNDQFYKQNESLAMGEPTSIILAEILYNLKNTHKNYQNSEQIPNRRLFEIHGRYINYIQCKHHKHRKYIKWVKFSTPKNKIHYRKSKTYGQP